MAGILERVKSFFSGPAPVGPQDLAPPPPPINLAAIINNTWHQWKNQWTPAVYNPDRIPVAQYVMMMETDETVYSGVEFIIMSALARLGDYVHPDKDIQEFVNANLEGMDGNFLTACGDILTAIPYGFSATEILWKMKQGQIWLRGLQTLHPETITLDIEVDGPDKNKLKTVWQYRLQAWEAEIPPSKVIVYSHRGHFGNYYGRSRLKSSFAAWFMKTVVFKSWGTCSERYGAPFSVAKVKDGHTHVLYGGKEMTLFDYTNLMLDSLSSKGSLAVDENTDVQLIYPGRGFGEDFHQLVGYCNTMIYRALGLPALIADQGKTGSYSLGKQHFELFVLVLESIISELIDAVIEQLIRPLIVYNFGEQDDYGDFARENLQVDDEKLISEVLATLVTSGILDTSRLEDINWMRDRMGLPLLSEEDVQPSLQSTTPVLPAESFSEARSFSWASRAKRRRWHRSRPVAEEGLLLPG